MILDSLGESEARLSRALESVDQAISLLDWRYQGEAAPSIALLQRLRDDLRVAIALVESDPQLLH
jgi:hypothetical protein